MRRIFLTLALGLLTTGAAAGDRAFLSTLDDVPLAPGLREVTGAGLLFDTPQGRIVEAYAEERREGAVARKAVRRFYRDTLPQLGWRRTGRARYRREGEVLRLAFQHKEATLTVRFTVTPADPGAGTPGRHGDS